MKKEEHERRMNFAREEAARIWCLPETEKITMDADLAEEFAKILVKHMYEPHLGCATTGEIIEELKARIEMDGTWDYRTIDHDKGD
jgi:predicted small metal-binding protein